MTTDTNKPADGDGNTSNKTDCVGRSHPIACVVNHNAKNMYFTSMLCLVFCVEVSTFSIRGLKFRIPIKKANVCGSSPLPSLLDQAAIFTLHRDIFPLFNGVVPYSYSSNGKVVLIGVISYLFVLIDFSVAFDWWRGSTPRAEYVCFMYAPRERYSDQIAVWLSMRIRAADEEFCVEVFGVCASPTQIGVGGFSVYLVSHVPTQWDRTC